ncbi:cupin domain-containing protein [Rhodococcus sp. NPDC056960]|uniref:cupin domain-containing protein n=1 Tax=Rhodococcus sp. NPDC056960 TaxID=3345982 RepID=UPI0036403140
MNVAPTGPVLTPAAGLEPVSDKYPRIRSRWIVPPGPDGWSGYAISEWELLQAGFTDHHPHDENAFVLAGALHVEVDGLEVVARAGDNIRVPAGKTGKYWAPAFARMLGIYGPNPGGAPSHYLEYWEIDD